MKNNKLYIPEKIVVGYKESDNALDGKKGYLTYHIQHNRLKHRSWFDMWRNKDLGIDTIDNVPTEGFIVNKAIYKQLDYNNNYQGIRIHDPRGFDIMVNVENIAYILTHANFNMGSIEGKFVYGWHNKSRFLIPVESQIYKDCVEHTNEVNRIKTSKVFTKDVKVGMILEHKNGNYYIYLGKKDVVKYDYYENKYTIKKYHLFRDINFDDSQITEWEHPFHKELTFKRFVSVSSDINYELLDKSSELLDSYSNISNIKLGEVGSSYNNTTFTIVDNYLYRCVLLKRHHKYVVEVFKSSIDKPFDMQKLSKNEILKLEFLHEGTDKIYGLDYFHIEYEYYEKNCSQFCFYDIVVSDKTLTYRYQDTNRLVILK